MDQPRPLAPVTWGMCGPPRGAGPRDPVVHRRSSNLDGRSRPGGEATSGRFVRVSPRDVHSLTAPEAGNPGVSSSSPPGLSPSISDDSTRQAPSTLRVCSAPLCCMYAHARTRTCPVGLCAEKGAGIQAWIRAENNSRPRATLKSFSTKLFFKRKTRKQNLSPSPRSSRDHRGEIPGPRVECTRFS